MSHSVNDFLVAVDRNPVVGSVLEIAAALSLPGWFLTGGCLFQTVWNVVSGRDPGDGILDYDLFYFDDTDLSWGAEDAAICRADRSFSDLGVKVEVRNEARVHLWYETKYGTPCPPFTRTEDAIDAFVATACCIGLRQEGNETSVYAPHGFDDMFNLVLRPNPVLAPRSVYETKAARWTQQWPSLQVHPWPATV